MNPYDVLGVEKDADKDQIKKAYQRLSMQHHPDRGGDEEEFKKISAAYDLLKNGDYQEGFTHSSRHQQHGGFQFTQADVEELMRRARHQHQMQVSVRVPIPIEVALLGKTIPLDLMIHGRQFTVEVNVPAGTRRGDAVRYPGLINGIDIIIIYEVQSSAEWAVEGSDIIKKQDVNIWDLITGTELNVDLVDGSTIRLKIPAGTQPNTAMRVPGKGIPSRDGFSADGNLHVLMNAKIPKDVPEAILKAIRENKS